MPNNADYRTGPDIYGSAPFRKSILLVEDDQDWQETFTDILARHGNYEVTYASNLQEARDRIQIAAAPFHVAIIDVNLDEADYDNQDGFLLLEELNATQYPARTVVVDHHKDAIDRLKQATKELRAIDYFEKIPPGKPFDEHSFMAAVHKAEELTGVVDVFVAMPFAPKYRSFYESAIRTPLEDLGLTCKRADELVSHRIIIEDIVRYIRHAKFIVTDLSENNLNVLFEAGLALAIQKPTVHLVRKIKDVPWMIQDNFQVYQYGVSLAAVDKLGKHLLQAVGKIEVEYQDPLFVDPPPAPQDGFCLGVVPKYRSSSNDAYTHIIRHVAEDLGLTIKRLGEIYGPGSGIRNGWENVNRSHIILSDLTGHDHGVFYWSGVAYGLRKKMVTLARKGEQIPFDLRGVHRVEYQMGFAAGAKARKSLKDVMTTLLQQGAGSKSEKAKKTGRRKKTGASKTGRRTMVPGNVALKAEGQQPVDVVILTVLEEEYLAVCRQLQKPQLLPGTRTEPNLYAWQAGTVFSKAYNSTYRVVVGMTVKAGNTQSSMAALEAVARWDPRYLFFSGIAGGLMNFQKAAKDPKFKPDIHLGDVVIASMIHGYEYGKIETDFNPRDDWTYQPDQGLLAMAIAFKTSPVWRNRIKKSPPRRYRPTILDGQIVSGDKVVDDPSNAFFSAVHKKWPKARAVEMEGAGVGAAINQARDRGRVVGFLMIRGISDLPRPPKSAKLLKKWEGSRGTDERDNWKPYAADVAAAVTVGLIAEGLPVPPRKMK